jgi:CheY-like chemotaxis protein
LLLVDDEPALLQPMTRYFARLGYDVAAAGQQAEALQFLETGAFDVAIVDMKLGPDETGGLQVVERLREHGTPVLVLSGLVTAELRRQAAAAGAGEVLQKPQPLSEIARIAELLQHPE